MLQIFNFSISSKTGTHFKLVRFKNIDGKMK